MSLAPGMQCRRGALSHYSNGPTALIDPVPPGAIGTVVFIPPNPMCFHAPVDTLIRRGILRETTIRSCVTHRLCRNGRCPGNVWRSADRAGHSFGGGDARQTAGGGGGHGARG